MNIIVIRFVLVRSFAVIAVLASGNAMDLYNCEIPNANMNLILESQLVHMLHMALTKV